MGPIVDGFEKKYADKVVFVKFYSNSASHLEVMRAQKIKALPTLKFINRRTEITGEMTGADKSKLEAELSRIL